MLGTRTVSIFGLHAVVLVVVVVVAAVVVVDLNSKVTLFTVTAD